MRDIHDGLTDESCRFVSKRVALIVRRMTEVFSDDADDATLSLSRVVSTPNAQGNTPLHLAVEAAPGGCDVESVRLLVGAGADTGAVNDDGFSPLQLARRQGGGGWMGVSG